MFAGIRLGGDVQNDRAVLHAPVKDPELRYCGYLQAVAGELVVKESSELQLTSDVTHRRLLSTGMYPSAVGHMLSSH